VQKLAVAVAVDLAAQAVDEHVDDVGGRVEGGVR
jgi:hypothetical protein